MQRPTTPRLPTRRHLVAAVAPSLGLLALPQAHAAGAVRAAALGTR